MRSIAMLWGGPRHGFQFYQEPGPRRVLYPMVHGHSFADAMYVLRPGQQGLSLRIFDFEGFRHYEPIPVEPVFPRKRRWWHRGSGR